LCLVGRLFVIALAPGVSSLVVTTARVRSLAIITAGVVVNVGAVIVHIESHSPTPGPPVTLHIHSDS